MLWFDGPPDGDDDDALVVLVQSVSAGAGSATAILSTLGVQAGDWAFVICNGGAPSSDGAGSWSAISNGSPTAGSFYNKQLNSADVAGTVRPGATNINWSIMVVRGVASIANVRTASAASDTVTGAGITRAANHAGFVGFGTANNSGGLSVNGFTSAPTFSTGTYLAQMVYRTAPPATPYTNGTGFTLVTGSPGTNVYLVIVELRR